MTTDASRARRRSRIVGAALLAFLVVGLFPPTERVLWTGASDFLRQPAGHRSVVSLLAQTSRQDYLGIDFPRLGAYWAAIVLACAVALSVAGAGLAWGRPLADSLAVGGANLLGALVAWSGLLSKLGAWGETAAFLSYFTWPMVGLILTLVTGLAALRDWKAGMVAQAALGIAATGCAVAFTATYFYGWE